MVDLSQPGSFVKDYVYLDGVVTVSEFLEREPDCYRMLCAAKISVYDVPVSASILVAPTVMPVDVMAAFDEVVEAGAASKERWATVVGGM